MPQGPGSILALLQIVDGAAKEVCMSIDRAVELEHDERHARKDLGKGVQSLKSDIMVYMVLLSAMEDDVDVNGCSPYTRFIQRYNFIRSHGP